MTGGLNRAQPCPECGAPMIWTQNACRLADGSVSAAYTCPEGHVVDPATTRQCPKCGVHDTTIVTDEHGRQKYRCEQCGELFSHPR